MSVLREIIKEREDWTNQQKVIDKRRHHTKAFVDYVMTLIYCVLPALVIVFWGKIVLLIKTLLP